jgi:O-antigen/teichoic acid export membrane protein
MTQVKRMLTGSGEIALYGGANLVRPVIGILTIPVFTRLFGPDDYGIIGIYTALVGLLTLLLPVNGHIYNLWNRAKLGSEGSAVAAGDTIVLSTGIGALCVVLAAIYWMVAPPADIPMWVAFLAVGTAWLTVWILVDTHIHQADGEASWFFGINLGWAVIFPIATIALALWVSSDWTAPIWGIVIASGLTALWSMYSLHRRRAIRVAPDSDSVRSVLRFGVPLLPHTVGLWAATYLDRFIVAGAVGIATTGIYTVAVSVALGLNAIHDGVSRFFAPRLARWTAEESAAGLRKAARFTYGYSIVSIVTIPAIVLAVNWLIDLLLPGEYAPVTEYLPWLIAAQAFIGIARMFTGYLYAAGWTGIQSIVTVTTAVVGLILAIVLVGSNGALGAAYAALIAAVFRTVVTYFAARRTQLLMTP